MILKNLTNFFAVPGMAGSPLEAKLDKPRVLDHSCTKKTDDYVLLWKDMKHLCPVTCFVSTSTLLMSSFYPSIEIQN